MEWRIYYADGTTEDNLWSMRGDVVAVVVYGGEYLTHTPDGPIVGRYKTLHYQDDDLGSFYFWMYRNKIYSGNTPRGKKIKGAAIPDDYNHIFANI